MKKLNIFIFLTVLIVSAATAVGQIISYPTPSREMYEYIKEEFSSPGAKVVFGEDRTIIVMDNNGSVLWKEKNPIFAGKKLEEVKNRKNEELTCEIIDSSYVLFGHVRHIIRKNYSYAQGYYMAFQPIPGIKPAWKCIIATDPILSSSFEGTIEKNIKKFFP